MKETLGTAELVLDKFGFFSVNVGEAISLQAEWAGGGWGRRFG
jgi:hypothetical protein